MKTAIVLFNLGGPDQPESVKKFRVNLFSDKAIIRAPWFVRVWLSRLIAASGQKAADENYARMGGRSPLLAITQAQAAALEAELGPAQKCFVAMRYWHPFAREVARAVKHWNPDRILLLPLYPQFSSTTTGSSLTDWREAAADAGLAKPTSTICCYYDDPGFIASQAALVAKALAGARREMPADQKILLLFSAHGLPESIIRAGDPYQAQIEACAAAILARLADQGDGQLVSYQSRATPQKWLSPSTIEAIEDAGRRRMAVLVFPIAFVSDHIETLVELDVELRAHARHAGVPFYFRAPVANTDPAFIAALAGLVRRSQNPGLCPGESECAAIHKQCPKNAA